MNCWSWFILKISEFIDIHSTLQEFLRDFCLNMRRGTYVTNMVLPSEARWEKHLALGKLLVTRNVFQLGCVSESKFRWKMRAFWEVLTFIHEGVTVIFKAIILFLRLNFIKLSISLSKLSINFFNLLSCFDNFLLSKSFQFGKSYILFNSLRRSS